MISFHDIILFVCTVLKYLIKELIEMFEILIQNGFEIFWVKYRVNAIKIIRMDYSYSVNN